MGLRPVEIFYFFQRADRFHTSESDVCTRQILTYKDGPALKGLNVLRSIGPCLQDHL